MMSQLIVQNIILGRFVQGLKCFNFHFFLFFFFSKGFQIFENMSVKFLLKYEKKEKHY